MLVVGERAVVREGLVEKAGPVLVIGADGVGIPQLVVDPPAFAASPYHDQSAVPGHRPGGSLGRGERGGQERSAGREAGGPQ